MRLLLIIGIFLTALIGGCDSKDWEAAGYSDGYASTINTACNFRTTLIHGKFDNAEYAKGYSRGAQAGSIAVAQQGCNKLK